MNPRKKSVKKSVKKLRQSPKKNVCWKGYHRVKGTVPYEKHSCVKNKRK